MISAHFKLASSKSLYSLISSFWLMSKRGQVTIFLVIGIVILLLAALFFYIFGQLKEAPLEVEAKEAQKIPGVRGTLQSYVENCIRETIDPAIYLLAIQGGVIYPEENGKILLTDYGIVNYAWLNGANGLSKEKMEKDLAVYLENYIDFCLGNFETFEKQNILVEANYDEIDALVTIKDAAVVAGLKLPLKVTLPNNDTADVDTFTGQVESNLGKMRSVVEELPFPEINPSMLLTLPYQPFIFPYDESVFIYSIAEKNGEAPLTFMFAVRNDFPKNEPPLLHFIADKTFRIGDQWQETLSAEDANHDILTFSSDSDLFVVKKDGTIDILVNQKGEFKVTLTVKDEQGEEDRQEFRVTVLDARE